MAKKENDVSTKIQRVNEREAPIARVESIHKIINTLPQAPQNTKMNSLYMKDDG
jgi:hypothetical protein